MSTLLLRLAAPLQSWGVGSKFETRNTQRAPTKSAVIGLLAAALGRGRAESLTDLSALKFAVRIDQPGKHLNDFHTAHHPQEKKRSFITHRHYLSDAVFVAGLEGDDAQINELAQALKAPIFPLFLGRRSCPPSQPLLLGDVVKKPLLDALRTVKWQAHQNYQKKQSRQHYLEIVTDADIEDSASFLVQDAPLSFDQAHRHHQWRRVKSDLQAVSIDNLDGFVEHDPISEFNNQQQKT